jgi:hypothetical protein
VRTISFDVKSAGAGCCAGFRIIAAGPRPATVSWPNDGTWTHIEANLPDIRPVSFEWQLWTGSAGVTPADGIWLDNIQFK